jgi:hypothetical protein
MGWIKKIGNAARDVGRIVAPGPSIIVDVATGKPVGDAVKDTVTAPVRVPVDAATTTVSALAEIDAKITELEAALIQKVGGNKAKNFFLDLRRVTVSGPVDIQTQKQLMESTQKFVETLDFGYLDPFVAATAGEIQRARDNFWGQAASVPEAVVNSMPTELAELARGTRHMLVADANALALPTFAIEHFGLASAVTAIDLIFFRTIPGSATAEDRHYWAHELTHVKQYRNLSLLGFTKKYVHQEMGKVVGQVGINALEVEADKAACAVFPIAQPFYIGSCTAV